MFSDTSIFGIGETVSVLYPVHGSKNVLRKVVGTVIHKGVGPNGPYIKVDSKNVFRNLSVRKIVPDLK